MHLNSTDSNSTLDRLRPPQSTEKHTLEKDRSTGGYFTWADVEKNSPNL